MIPGRTSITPRALERAVRGVVADHLGVAASRVSVRLSDAAGALAVWIAAPLRSSERDGFGDAPGLVTRSALARAAIAQDITTISGARVGAVTLRVTGVDIVKERRVS